MWMNLLINLAPVIFGLMQMAENTVTQPKSGPEKKNLVMGIIRAIVNVSTGGQKEAWTQIESVAGLIIDLVTPFLFPKV